MTPAIDFTGCQIPTFLLDPSAEEPYTTERLSEIRHGYRKLSATIKILEVDFNSVEVSWNICFEILFVFKKWKMVS